MHYKVFTSKHQFTYKILWHLDRSCYRDKVNRAAGRCAGALFFARNLDNFIMTRQFASIYRDLVPLRQFIVTRSFHPSTGTGKKRGTPTRTPTNQTAGPLYLSHFATDKETLTPKWPKYNS